MKAFVKTLARERESERERTDVVLAVQRRPKGLVLLTPRHVWREERGKPRLLGNDSAMHYYPPPPTFSEMV